VFKEPIINFELSPSNGFIQICGDFCFCCLLPCGWRCFAPGASPGWVLPEGNQVGGLFVKLRLRSLFYLCAHGHGNRAVIALLA